MPPERALSRTPSLLLRREEPEVAEGRSELQCLDLGLHELVPHLARYGPHDLGTTPTPLGTRGLGNHLGFLRRRTGGGVVLL